jgi:hypothetical protein
VAVAAPGGADEVAVRDLIVAVWKRHRVIERGAPLEVGVATGWCSIKEICHHRIDHGEMRTVTGIDNGNDHLEKIDDEIAVEIEWIGVPGRTVIMIDMTARMIDTESRAVEVTTIVIGTGIGIAVHAEMTAGGITGDAYLY